MMRVAVLVVVAMLAGCASESDDEMCESATSVDGGPPPADLTCVWQCTTRDGHAVVLSWDRYAWTGNGYAVAESETIAGACAAP